MTGSESWHAWQAKQKQERRHDRGGAGCGGGSTSWHEAAARRLVEAAATSASALLCPLCGGKLALGREPDAVAWLSCGHAFCHRCLRAFVDERYGASCWGLPCPACGTDSAPPWGVWHLYVRREAADSAAGEARAGGGGCAGSSSVAPPGTAAAAAAAAAGSAAGAAQAADPRPFDYGMCAQCAVGGWFSAAGRRCLNCATVLCDTCAFAHVVSSGQDGATEHKLASLTADSGGDSAADSTAEVPLPPPHELHQQPCDSAVAARQGSAGPVPAVRPQLQRRWAEDNQGGRAQRGAAAAATQACRAGGWLQQLPAPAAAAPATAHTADHLKDCARRATMQDGSGAGTEPLASSSCTAESAEDGAAARLAAAFCSATSLHSYVVTM